MKVATEGFECPDIADVVVRVGGAVAPSTVEAMSISRLHRLLGAGAMPVSPLVLLAERLLEMGDHAGIHRALGHRYR